MKITLPLIAILLWVSPLAFAGSIDGTWIAEFTDPPGRQPITVDKATFEIRQDGNKLTGMAHVGKWPGDAPITEGKIEGDHFSFTVVSDSPWRSTQAGSTEVTVGYPKLEFSGTIEGGEMTLTLKWSAIIVEGNPNVNASLLHMRGRKAPAQ
jgi:hypothetical protein